MLGNRWLRNVGSIGQGMHGLLPVAGESLENRSTGRISESLEYIVSHGLHDKTITDRL